MTLPPPPPLPPIWPYLPFTPSRHSDQDPSPHNPSSTAFSTFHNQNHRVLGDTKLLSDLDKEEFALEAKNVRIAIHGQLYLRPPGLEPYTPPGYYADQDQATPAQVDETFNAEEDEEGLPLTEEEEEEEVEEYYDEEEEEEEEGEQDLDAGIEPPSEASYMTMSPNTSMVTPARTRQGNLFEAVGSPTTPSNMPRNQSDIEALSDLVDAISRGHGGLIMDAIMDLDEGMEEEEESDLDAEVEDMDENTDSEEEEMEDADED